MRSTHSARISGGFAYRHSGSLLQKTHSTRTEPTYGASVAHNAASIVIVQRITIKSHATNTANKIFIGIPTFVGQDRRL